MDLTLWIELTLFMFLMALPGFFSRSETSLFSLGKIQLEQMRRDGHASLNRSTQSGKSRYNGGIPGHESPVWVAWW